MAKKDLIYQGLLDVNVLIEDTSSNSPDYFRIIKLPTEFSAGINTFKFRGGPAFTDDTPVYIEVLDANGDPIYFEAGVDQESESKSAVVSVYINEDTSPGYCTVILCSTAATTASGVPLPTDKFNIRWTSKVYVDVSKRNTDDIIFSTLPTVSVTAVTGSYTNFGYPGGHKLRTETITGLTYYYYNNTAILVTGSNSNVAFDSTATSATITISSSWLSNINPTFPGVLNSNVFSASLVSYKGPGVAVLSEPINFPISNYIDLYVADSGLALSASITYEQSASNASSGTENSHNKAVVFFTNLQPQVGTVAKIYSYYRSAGVGEYIFSNETDISDLAAEYGFAPEVVTASFFLPTVHRNDRLDFKFEFVNPAGNVSKQVVESLDNLFLGGNTYIGGDDNLLTGSLFVAGATGTGVHISGKANAAMVRSIGYTGFANAITGSGAAGFVMYSGSIQSILGSSEAYSGVGLELVANNSSYFKYGTANGGNLEVYTNKFFFGNSASYISSSNGAMSIYSTNFKLTTEGHVTASSILVQKTPSGGSLQTMIDTDASILDASNLARTLYATENETSYSSSAALSSYIVPIGSFIFQGLVNEYRYTVSFQHRLNLVSAVGTTGTVLILRLRYCNSGSYYDTWSAFPSGDSVTCALFSTSSTGIYDITLSEGYRLTDRSVDLLGASYRTSKQGKLLKCEISCSIDNTLNNAFTASFKNITVTAGRGLSSVYGGGFDPNAPLPA
jgi:hypothetical protein